MFPAGHVFAKKVLFSFRNVSSLRLNSAKIFELTVSEGDAFQLFTTLWLKKRFKRLVPFLMRMFSSSFVQWHWQKGYAKCDNALAYA